ncbi:MAG: [FeFe] hydrogenase H-cluster radical SAM maturase HydE [Enterococcaceae bacterium]|jgi:biotin synthase|nr:[FeFe] hydrogenase H-cluster radical SAM maturase HydE [Enterococcaceae bacterium]MCI1918835.1 [FeFe] hydrogenase H-cluster radical SAM maturase HydE [Enterococcaceae bacterium]
MKNIQQRKILDRLSAQHSLAAPEWLDLLQAPHTETVQSARRRAVSLREQHYQKKVFIRGLIEFTNHCRKNCFYCGIRHDLPLERYRLTEKEILACCDTGYQLGFRTFVMQGGEDPAFSADQLAQIIGKIKEAHPDCAITLSFGEHSKESYRLWKAAGADRYLLRHETANAAHYAKLHPAGDTLVRRQQCLWNLKELGYQVGTGFMVGSPWQTPATLVEDFLFLQELQPEMVGIGPFIPHHATKFADFPAGSPEETLYLLSLIRLLLPSVLLPATTALSTIDASGQEKGMLSGCNVIMPNLSPLSLRKKYLLYDNKAFTGDEASESLRHIREKMRRIGYEIVVDRGDFHKETEQVQEKR